MLLFKGVVLWASLSPVEFRGMPLGIPFYISFKLFIFFISKLTKIIVTINAIPSAIGPAYIKPSIPNILGSIMISGSKNINCRVIAMKAPLIPFPIEVKKVPDTG